MTIAPALHVLLAMPVLAGAAEGHFAAWEPPKYLSEEVRAGFRSLRT